MRPDGRDQVTRLYRAALERPAEARDAYLREACGSDESLRSEVESLLRYEPRAGGFLQCAVAGVLSSVNQSAEMIGAEFGQYHIISCIGLGGMGEVYRARDRKLGRDVAIKFLPHQFTSDPERRARFAREARVLATLRHPNIGTIYGFEDFGDRSGLILELLEGRTLAARLEQGPLKLTDALSIARQIAEALDAAHLQGIVHRDLKPSNIVLEDSGSTALADVRVKVLDFGLAKTISSVNGAEQQHQAATMEPTDPGRILGTPAYMSPEQARGELVDRRTDIWAFGCVLFEMVTGRRPFDGGSAADTLARILEREPDWHVLPSETPASIRALLQRCLQKNPLKRLRDIADARFELEDTNVAGASTSDSDLSRAAFPRRIAMRAC